MRVRSFNLSVRRAWRIASALLFAWLIVSACGPASAQSGRRIPTRRPSAPEPAPPPPAAAPPAPKPEAAKIPLSVAKYVDSINIPNNIADLARDECVRTLRESSAFAVTVGKDMNRSDAVKLAKSGEETYVLWLQVSQDMADEDRGSMGSASLRNLLLTYVVYTPGTGKVKTQGRLYFNALNTSIGRGPVMVPGTGIGRGASGYTPEEAGQKAATYILDSFQRSTVPVRI